MLNFWLLVLSSFLPQAEAAMPVINAPAATQQVAAQEELDPAEQARLVEAVVEQLIQEGKEEQADAIRQSGVIPAYYYPPGPRPPYPPYGPPPPYFRPPPPYWGPVAPPVYEPPVVVVPVPVVPVPVVPVPVVPVPVFPAPCPYYSCY